MLQVFQNSDEIQWVKTTEVTSFRPSRGSPSCPCRSKRVCRSRGAGEVVVNQCEPIYVNLVNQYKSVVIHCDSYWLLLVHNTYYWFTMVYSDWEWSVIKQCEHEGIQQEVGSAKNAGYKNHPSY